MRPHVFNIGIANGGTPDTACYYFYRPRSRWRGMVGILGLGQIVQSPAFLPWPLATCLHGGYGMHRQTQLSLHP